MWNLTGSGQDRSKVDKSKITDRDILKYLPPFTPTAKQVAQMYIITRYSGADVYLAKYEEFRFAEEAAVQIMHKFQDELVEYGKYIDKRGWDHMHPAKIPASTDM